MQRGIHLHERGKRLLCSTSISIPDGELGEIPKKDLKDFVVFDSFMK